MQIVRVALSVLVLITIVIGTPGRVYAAACDDAAASVPHDDIAPDAYVDAPVIVAPSAIRVVVIESVRPVPCAHAHALPVLRCAPKTSPPAT